MLALLALAVIGPHLLLSDDIDLDGKKDQIYWQYSIHPVVDVSDLTMPTLLDIELYVKSKGKMDLVGRVEGSTFFQGFWIKNTSTGRKRLVFKFIIHGLERYFGVSKAFKMFEIPKETFA